MLENIIISVLVCVCVLPGTCLWRESWRRICDHHKVRRSREGRRGP